MGYPVSKHNLILEYFLLGLCEKLLTPFGIISKVVAKTQLTLVPKHIRWNHMKSPVLYVQESNIGYFTWYNLIIFQMSGQLLQKKKEVVCQCAYFKFCINKLKIFLSNESEPGHTILCTHISQWIACVPFRWGSFPLRQQGKNNQRPTFILSYAH